MTIWYDLSGIFQWKGYFTGIQRVVYNLAKELAESDQPVKFFVYNGGRFSEVSFAELDKRLAELSEQDGIQTQNDKLSFAKIQHHGMVALKNGVRGSRLETPARTLYSGLRITYRLARSRGVRTRASYSHLFTNDDVVIVVDGNWQFAGYAQAMAIAKQHASFQLIHMVHDMVAVRNPALANTGADRIIGNYFKKIFSFADGLIAISESTKRDIQWFMDSIELKRELPVFSIRLGDNISTDKIRPKQPAGIDKDFILAVSTIEIRKNYVSLYYVYKLALQKNLTLPPLVIVGRKGWLAEEAFALLTKDPEVSQSITVLRHAADDELEWLYEHCLFTVFPSFYEGWGLPIVESLSHGKVCLSSNTSSLPEVGGQLVSYFSPFDSGALLTEIRKLMDKNTREKMEKEIKKSYKPRDWHQAYSDLKVIINQLTD